MSDFLLGRLGTLTQGVPNTTFTYKWYHGLYGQDAWKVTPRLTLNAGVRWEPFLPQGFTNGAVYNFSFDRLKQGIHSTVFRKAPAGLLYAGDPGFNGKTGVNNRYDQFAPRVGLAFDPKGDGKTSIRASFGMFYDYPNIMIEWYPHVLVISTLLPQAVDRTLNVVEFYYPEDIALFEREFVEAERAAYMETCIEDDEIAERMDAGRLALLKRGVSEIGPYQSPMEDGMQHFHEWYRNNIDLER